MDRKKLIIGLISLPLLTVALVWAWPHDAEYYYNRGQERLEPTDEDGGGADERGALADFRRAIPSNHTERSLKL